MKLLVDFFGCPEVVLCVLGHLKTGDCDSTGVGCFAGCERDTGCLEGFDCLRGASHVGCLDDILDAVLDKELCIVTVELVLKSAGECHVDWDFPWLLALDELCAEFLCVRLDDVHVGCSELEHVGDLLGSVDSVLVKDVSVRSGECDDLGTELGGLCDCAPCDVTEAGDCYSLACEAVVVLFEHFVCEIHCSVTCCFRSDTASAPSPSFSCEDAGVLVADLSVCSVEVSDFSSAYSEVSGRDICIRTDVLLKLCHESTAESHDFCIRSSSW